jgi:hypothetical protein
MQIKDLLKDFSVDNSLQDQAELLIKLEYDRNYILKTQEEWWQLKSRAIWVQSGDKNTKIFNQFANQRRINKHLWAIKDDLAQLHTSQETILKAVD